MMNITVPEFEADEDYLIQGSPKTSIMGGDEDVMELLWQNGQVVMQSRNQRSVGNKKPETRPPVGSRDIRSSVVEEETGPSDLFMQEDEMASWLHYPVDDHTLEGYLYSNDLLYPTPPSSTPVTTTPCSLPPPPPPSIMIPSPHPPVAPIDVEFGCLDAKKQSHGSTSTKRSRAAEVHNLSERRRRDRINEKMKALQELIPRSNKSDKASILDEAIEYLKSLQMQVQMMSMGCNMVPMMFPGVQQYMPPMAMGMGMGMGMSMSMDMGMNHVMVPYPAILPGSSVLPSPGTHMGPRFPVPGFNIHPVNATCPATSQATNLSAPMMSSFPLHNQNQPQVPNFADPFQQYIGLRHQTPSPLPQ